MNSKSGRSYATGIEYHDTACVLGDGAWVWFPQVETSKDAVRPVGCCDYPPDAHPAPSMQQV